MKLEKLVNFKSLEPDNYYWIKVKDTWKIRRVCIADGVLFFGETPYSHTINRFPEAEVAGPIPLPNQFNY